MEFDDAKENIQPLACGRNVHMLHASLRKDTHELMEERRRLEKEIQDYAGEDPLEPWYHFIDWIEQSCPSGGKESGLQDVFVKCLTRFEKETKYYQDERMVKLYIKFISSLKEPLEKYEALYNAGIGTMVADFYISWAYVADQCGNSRKADEIFLHGIRCNAQPKDVLEEAHQHFRYYVSQRLMYKDDEEVQCEANRQLSERRLALASLRRRGKKATVGSIRTGTALKSHVPGVIRTSAAAASCSKNMLAASHVYHDENNELNSIKPPPVVVLEQENASAVRMLIDAARNQENEIEPGPWNQKQNKRKLFAKETHLDFEIHEDSTCENVLPKVVLAAIKLPPHWVAKNQPQAVWEVPITTQEKAEHAGLPMYNKCLLYPRPNKEFQLEELILYYHYKRRGIENYFTAARDSYWSTGDVDAPVRQYPNFAKENLPQTPDALDSYYQPSDLARLKTCAEKLYNADLQQEFQLEEIMWQKRQERMMNTQYSDDAMEETMCANSERVKQRKSFFPVHNRKSIFPTTTPKETENIESPKPSGIMATLLPNLSEVEQKLEEKEKFLPFEIYEDTTQPKMLLRASKHNDTPRFIAAQVDTENIELTEFTFKAPLPPPPPPPPLSAPAPAPALTMHSPAVVEDNMAVGYYDADETCCTQQFNTLFKLKDKMSTPVTHKTVKRVTTPSPIKEVAEKILEERVTPTNAATVMTSPETDQAYFKNLSTILETSEHGSSHTTATSKATTKSSCVSTNELESTPASARLKGKMKVMEMLPQETNTDMEIMNLPEKAVNFTRLEERDNTAQLCGFLSNVRFQEDNTETMTNKLLIPSIKFQEDRTETFTKLLKPMANAIFQDDKTDTFSKLLPPPMMPMEKTPVKMPAPQSMCNFSTPDLLIKTPPSIKNNKSSGNLNSTANLLLKDSILQIPNTPPAMDGPKVNTTPSFQFRDSFVPETQPVNITDKENNDSFWNPPDLPLLGNLSMAERWAQNSPQQNKEAEPQKSFQNKHMLPDSFIKDFHMPAPMVMENKLPFANTSALKFLNESTKTTTTTTTTPPMQQTITNQLTIKQDLLNFSNTSTLKFLDDAQKMQQQQNKLTFANTSTLRFLNDSTKTTTTTTTTTSPMQHTTTNKQDLLNFSNKSTLKFLNDAPKMQQEEEKEEEEEIKNSERKCLNKMNFFEGNMETAQFNINNSMIKNSTCLVVEKSQPQDFIMEQSVHIKEEPMVDKSVEVNDDMSIYFKKTPKTPKETCHTWLSGIKTPIDNKYVHPVINLDATQKTIQTQCSNQLLNPFSITLRTAFLDDIAFTEYISTLSNCQMQRHVSRLHAKQQIEIKNQKFEINKLIGEGGFGSVYKGKHLPKGTKVALKQEQPPKLWEYYICLEIQSRIKVDDMLSAYMSIDWALIGSNSSILVYGFSTHGSLIQVCNKVRKITNKHLDEFVVMFMAREILEIIDHLHAINIIHADIKPDNILVVQLLNYKNETRSLQLIDFGESIDMRLFQNQQQFKYVYEHKDLKCVEMREGRPWTYQLDLYGVCGIIHALLFGKYMEVEQKSNGMWMPKIRMPRYFHKDLWDNIFETLLNVKDCDTIPDLQSLRKLLKEVLVENQTQVLQKLSEFNLNLRS